MYAYRIWDEDQKMFLVSGKGKTIWAKRGGCNLAFRHQQKYGIRLWNKDHTDFAYIAAQDRKIFIKTYMMTEVDMS
jgi:hypothetical protein